MEHTFADLRKPSRISLAWLYLISASRTGVGAVEALVLVPVQVALLRAQTLVRTLSVQAAGLGVRTLHHSCLALIDV